MSKNSRIECCADGDIEWPDEGEGYVGYYCSECRRPHPFKAVFGVIVFKYGGWFGVCGRCLEERKTPKDKPIHKDQPKELTTVVQNTQSVNSYSETLEQREARLRYIQWQNARDREADAAWLERRIKLIQEREGPGEMGGDQIPRHVAERMARDDFERYRR